MKIRKSRRKRSVKKGREGERMCKKGRKRLWIEERSDRGFRFYTSRNSLTIPIPLDQPLQSLLKFWKRDNAISAGNIIPPSLITLVLFIALVSNWVSVILKKGSETCLVVKTHFDHQDSVASTILGHWFCFCKKKKKNVIDSFLLFVHPNMSGYLISQGAGLSYRGLGSRIPLGAEN